jgi:hypothetical protein
MMTIEYAYFNKSVYVELEKMSKQFDALIPLYRSEDQVTRALSRKGYSVDQCGASYRATEPGQSQQPMTPTPFKGLVRLW